LQQLLYLAPVCLVVFLIRSVFQALSSRKKTDIIPALAFESLTRYYDVVVSWTCREETFKAALVHQVEQSVSLEALVTVLDVGCGTGTLLKMLLKARPLAKLHGLDADSTVLDLARGKLGEQVVLAKGFAHEMPFSSASMDIVTSSLFFHHLTTNQKRKALTEIRRLLRSRGTLHVADWGKPSSLLMRSLFLVIQLLDGFDTTQDSVTGLLPQLMADAGFVDVTCTSSFSTVFGTIRLFKCSAP
jgi:ubiquinone/menaquinone biosynthesis C-methylase UbiE